MVLAFHGLILAETLHFGVDHYDHAWDDVVDDGDIVMMPDEWGLGDKAYINIGCEQMLAGRKPEVTHFGTFWNSIIPFYMGRVEVVIARSKRHAWCHTAHLEIDIQQ